jgi:hypothetical protein
MNAQMAWHRAAVIRDQREAIGFAPQQDVGIQRSNWRSSRVSDTPDNYVRILRVQSLAQTLAYVFVKKILPHAICTDTV